MLFGLNDQIDKSFNADAVSSDGKIVIEVEAGRAVDNNQFLKILVARDGVEPPTRGFSVFKFRFFDFGWVQITVCKYGVMLISLWRITSRSVLFGVFVAQMLHKNGRQIGP